MEAVYYAARANLRRLMILHPSWTQGQLAQATGMSKSWVDTWKKRLLSVPPDDEQVLCGLSHAPHHPPPRLDPEAGRSTPGNPRRSPRRTGSHTRSQGHSLLFE